MRSFLRNKINNRKKVETELYNSERISRVNGDSASSWKIVKNVVGWKTSGSVNQLIENNKLITKASEIAKILNEWFVKKVVNLGKSIPFSEHINLQKCRQIMAGKNCKFSLIEVTVGDVNKILKKLKNSKSLDVDELDSFSVRIDANIIDEPLHHIIMLSLSSGKFPDKWKYAKIIPLFKKDDKLDKKNYRPVAILSPLSTVLERIYYNQLYSYFNNNKLFNRNHHG